MAKRTIHKTEERIDPATGEIVKSGYVIMIDKPKGDEDFIKVFKCCTQAVLADLGIENGRAMLLFWFMNQVHNLKINQLPMVVATTDMMSKDLGCSEISIKRWLSFLIEKGFIKRYYTPTGRIIYNNYIINPSYMIKGKLSQMEKEDI